MSESFRIVCLINVMNLGGEYIDQRQFITYEEALERGEELLKHYPAFRIEKLYEL